MAIQSLTPDELLALLREARAARTRDWLMILVGFWHGLRVSEIVSLTRDNVRDGCITVARLKGSERTTHPLFEHPEPLLSERAAMIELAEHAPYSTPLFNVGRQHFWRLFARYAKQAGIPAHKRHPHVLKHSIATKLIDKIGVPATRIYLGHRSGASTLEYAKPQEEDVTRAVQGVIQV